MVEILLPPRNSLAIYHHKSLSIKTIVFASLEYFPAYPILHLADQMPI